MKHLLAALMATTALAGTAVAADLPSRAYAPAVVAPIAYTWSGLYVGINAGYGWGDTKRRFDTAGHYNLLAGDGFRRDVDGWLVGGHLGYNFQINNFVLGLEGSIAWSDIDKRNAVSPYFPATDRWTSKVNWLASITPRVGVAFDRALIYVKGGVAFGEVSDRVNDGVDFVSAKNTRTGWTLGAGVEYAITNNVVFGVEYNYYDLGKYRVNKASTDIATGVTQPFGTNHRVDTTVNTVTARLSYKF